MRLLALLLLLPAAGWSAPVHRVAPRNSYINAPAVRLSFAPHYQTPNLKGGVLNGGLPVLTVNPGPAVAASATTAPDMAVVEAVTAVRHAVENGGVAETSVAGQVLHEAITGEGFRSGSGTTLVAAPSGGQGSGGSRLGRARRFFQFKPSRRDEPQSPKPDKKRYIPILTTSLMLLNGLVYAGQTALAKVVGTEGVFDILGYVPDHLKEALVELRLHDVLFESVSALVATFVHGGAAHLQSNLLGIAIFGWALEMGMPRGRMLLTYLAAGFIAHVTLVTGLGLANGGPSSWFGASGPLFGLMGAYLATLPGRVMTPGPWNTVKIALGVTAAMFVLQEVVVWASKGPLAGGIAHSVHVFGFIVGLLFGVFFMRRKP